MSRVDLIAVSDVVNAASAADAATHAGPRGIAGICGDFHDASNGAAAFVVHRVLLLLLLDFAGSGCRHDDTTACAVRRRSVMTIDDGSDA